MTATIPSAAATEALEAATANLASGSGALQSLFASLGLGKLSNVLAAIVIFLVCLVVVKVLCRVIDRLLARSKHAGETVRRFLHTAVRIVLWAVAIVIIAGALGIPTASLVAVVSIAGLALSLSVQNILTNLFSGVTLLFTRPFNVGDFVSIGDNAGTVESIGLFYTTVVTVDKRVITLPNSDVASSALTNFSREPLRRVSFVFGTEYSDPTDRAMEALRGAIADCPMILAEPEPILFISAFKDSSIEYTMHVWCKNEDYWPVNFQMNELVRQSFERCGVHMSYNHLNVHILSDQRESE